MIEADSSPPFSRAPPNQSPNIFAHLDDEERSESNPVEQKADEFSNVSTFVNVRYEENCTIILIK